MSTFSGNRLKLARERRALTQKALAEAIGATSASISQYEACKIVPPTVVGEALSFALRHPVGFFYAADVERTAEEAVSFRSRRSMTGTIRDRTLASADIAITHVQGVFEKRFDLPDIDVPDLSGHTPEDAASLLREYWQLGQEPISNMTHLLESKGVRTFWIDVASPCVDAVSFWRNEVPYVLFNVTKPDGERGRFDSGHELAHLVLHRHHSTLDQQQLEQEADRFASSFLMPPFAFLRHVGSYRSIYSLLPEKAHWGVSVQAMTRRLYDLGVIKKWQYESAFKEMSILGWRRGEDRPLKREQSRAHEIIYTSLVNKGIYVSDFAEITGLQTDDLLELTPVARNFPFRKTIQQEQEYKDIHLFG